MVARLIPQLYAPYRTLRDTSDDLHGSGRLSAAAISRSLMGDLLVAGMASARPEYMYMEIYNLCVR